MAREQRRLAAIVAVDAVGYSRLMGRDESGTVARLREHRQQRLEPVLVRHGGRLVKLTGDGALVEFPSAVDALGAAIEFQQAMADVNRDQPEDTAIVFRAGLHLGDLIVDGDDLYGDGVNVAARLEAEASAGGIVISGNVHDAVAGRLKATFGDLGNLTLKNIERPLQAFRVQWEAADWPTSAVLPSGAASQPADVPLLLPDKPSIAVLPFQNMSDDLQQEYFADGMVEDIITALSRFKSLFVIARNSSFSYKGKSPDIRQVGRELGVRYVLEGSVRRAGGRVRITGQLIDSTTGAHLWADRFDGALEDVFDLQDRMTESVVGELSSQVQIAEIERGRRKPTMSLNAYDYYLRGVASMHGWTKTSNQIALEHFSKAIELDNDFALAHAYAGMCYTLRKQSRWMVDVGEESSEAIRISRRAIELGRDDAFALAMGGFNLAYVADELDVGAECIARALSMNSNLALGWNYSGWVKIYLGEPETALEHLGKALRLSPRDPTVMQVTTAMALAHYFAGRFEETTRLAEKVTGQVPTFLPAWRMMAMGYAMGGQPDRAKRAAGKVLELDPSARVSILVPLIPLRRSMDRERYKEGLCRAGLPE